MRFSRTINACTTEKPSCFQRLRGPARVHRPASGKHTGEDRRSTEIGGLIQRTENGWLAHGWPVCGSSEICHNESMPIRAIVMLAQAKENRVVRLCGMQAFRLIYSQITINRWNNDHVTSAMDLIEKLITEVPVLLLECDISEDAVVCLEDALNDLDCHR